jgi:membrane-associated phospholipid phosphatase
MAPTAAMHGAGGAILGDFFEPSLALIRWLQQFSPALDRPMLFITSLGSADFYLAILPLLYWLVSPRLAIRLLLVLVSTDALVNALKLTLAQPRPFFVSPSVRGIVAEGSYGFPSGHAGDATAFWGYLATHLRRRWVSIAAVTLVLLISLSRLYLGVHYLHDVIGGWALGLLVVGLAGPVERWATPWLKGQGLARRLALAAALALGLLAVGAVATRLTPIPPPWPEVTAEPHPLTPWLTASGALLGALAGYALMLSYARFAPGGRWPRRVACVAIGLAGVLVIWRGLPIILGPLATDGTALGDGLRLARYCLMTLWATLAAPWLFLRLGLARPAD